MIVTNEVRSYSEREILPYLRDQQRVFATLCFRYSLFGMR